MARAGSGFSSIQGDGIDLQPPPFRIESVDHQLVEPEIGNEGEMV